MHDCPELAELRAAEVRERRRTKGSKDPQVALFKSEVSSPPRAYSSQGLALPVLDDLLQSGWPRATRW